MTVLRKVDEGQRLLTKMAEKGDSPGRLGPQVVESLGAEVSKRTLEALLEARRHFAGLA